MKQRIRTLLAFLLLLPLTTVIAKPVTLVCDLNWSYEAFTEEKVLDSDWTSISSNYLPLGMLFKKAKTEPSRYLPKAEILSKGFEACLNSDYLIRFSLDLETNDLQTQNAISVERRISTCYDDYFCTAFNESCGAIGWANRMAQLTITPNRLATETMKIHRKTLLGSGGKNLSAYGPEAFQCEIRDIDTSENQI